MSSVPCSSSIRFLYWLLSFIDVDTLLALGVECLLPRHGGASIQSRAYSNSSDEMGIRPTPSLLRIEAFRIGVELSVPETTRNYLRNFTKLLSTKLRINGNVDDQGLVYQSYCPCAIPGRCGCYWPSTGSSDHARHCLRRARCAGAEGRNNRDPSWSNRGGWGASAHPQGHGDDFLPSLRCDCRFLECA